MKNPPDINFIPAFHMRDFCVRAHLTQTRYALKTCEAQTWDAQRSSARMED